MLKKLLIVAGGGDYPRLLIEGAKRAGVAQVEVAAIKGSTLHKTCAVADAVYPTTLGRLAEGIRDAGRRGYDGVIFAGQINPLSLFRGRFSPEVRGWLDSLPVKNAHSIFQLVIRKFEEVGLKVLPASLFMDEHIPGVGPLTKRALTEREQSDLKHAINVAHDVGLHDVGQLVMVKHGMVVAVEAFEGSNAAIRRGGKLGGAGGVVFKAAREGHDMRFDIPVVGLKTFKVLHKAGATVLGFQAGRLILFDREKSIAYADKHGIAFVGIDSGLAPAPLRP